MAVVTPLRRVEAAASSGDILLYTDGASRGNPGEAAICFRLISPTGEVLEEKATRIGRATNNQAEYRALIAGLESARSFTSGRLQCRSDSELLIKQMRREYRVKEPGLKLLSERARALSARFAGVEFRHVRRSDPEIARADELANRALDAPAG